MRHVELREDELGNQYIFFYKNNVEPKGIIPCLDLNKGVLVMAEKNDIEEVFPLLVGHIDTNDLKKYI